MKLSAEEQSQLMALAARGDQAAFKVLHDAVARQVYGFIRARTDNDADASEILQETWLKFWKSIARYDPQRANCVTFLRSIAYSVLVDYYRSRDRGRDVLISDLLERAEHSGLGSEIESFLGQLPPSAATIPPKGSDLVTERALLHVVLHGTSPPHQLLAFGFAELQGWTPSEITLDFSEALLRHMEGRLEKDYSATSMLSADVIESCFSELRGTMDRLLDESLQDSKTRELYASLLNEIIGDTTLRQYYGGDPRQNISHWCQAVRRRLITDSAHVKHRTVTPIAAISIPPSRIEN